MADPRVSVLMSTCDRPEFIAQSIASAERQTMPDWELIIVDDSGDGATGSVVAPLAAKDKRIRYFHRPRKGNIANGSNFGLAKARADYIAILDDDDWWRDARKLEKQTAFLDRRPEYIGCGGWAVVVNGRDEEGGRIKKPTEDAAIRRRMLYANPILNSAGMFRRAPAGFYDETLRQFADWDFWLKLGKLGKLYNFPEYFLSYRMWREGSSFVHQKENAAAAFAIVRRYRRDYPGFAAAFFLESLYWLYARSPLFLRRGMNALLSRAKKSLFSR